MKPLVPQFHARKHVNREVHIDSVSTCCCWTWASGTSVLNKPKSVVLQIVWLMLESASHCMLVMLCARPNCTQFNPSTVVTPSIIGKTKFSRTASDLVLAHELAPKHLSQKDCRTLSPARIATWDRYGHEWNKVADKLDAVYGCKLHSTATVVASSIYYKNADGARACSFTPRGQLCPQQCVGYNWATKSAGPALLLCRHNYHAFTRGDVITGWNHSTATGPRELKQWLGTLDTAAQRHTATTKHKLDARYAGKWGGRRVIVFGMCCQSLWQLSDMRYWFACSSSCSDCRYCCCYASQCRPGSQPTMDRYCRDKSPQQPAMPAA